MARASLVLPVVLPDSEFGKQQCAGCVERRLAKAKGITAWRFTDSGKSIELNYDPDVLTVAQVERELRATQGCLSPDIAHLMMNVRGMRSNNCEEKIRSALKDLPGLAATPSYAAGTLRLEFDRRVCLLPDIALRLSKLGYTLEPQSAGASARNKEPAFLAGWYRWLLAHPQVALVVISGVLLAIGTAMVFMGLPLWAYLPVLIASGICSSTDTAPEAWASVRRLRLDVDVLMFVAAAGAGALGHWEEGALLLFLFGAGSAGEHLALSRARDAISELTRLTPQTAQRINPDGSTSEVRIEELAVGQQVLVRPYARLPADGTVLEGDSAVDQSAITGESVPVEKTVGDECFGGTLNGAGRLILQVDKAASDSTLARIVKMVEEAQTTKSTTQRFTDKVEAYYVPCVMLSTTALIFAPPLLGILDWGTSFYRAMAFLTAASPCALAIGTPAAVLCGIARAAKDGLLIKGGIHLEQMAACKAVAFDKTGTLTTGKLTVSDVTIIDNTHTQDSILTLAAALEAHSTHPLADAIVRASEERNLPLPEVADVTQQPGQGMTATYQGKQLAVGKPTTQELSEPAIAALMNDGKSVVAIRLDGRLLGMLSLSDDARPGAATAVQQLHAMNIRPCVMLTGDHESAAKRVAQAVGIDHVYHSLLPADKLKLISDLSTRHGGLAMVGDGVNDAPALAAASVGIAVGGGSAVALETADVVLMGGDVARLPNAFRLAKRARRIIAQNLLIALGVIAVVAPISALGFTSLAVAVFLHEGSTVVVVLNSLRLLRKK